MKKPFFKNKRAIGLIEIVIAVIIVVGAGIPILKMVTSSRTETSSSVNYLRAVELADEVLEWASASKFSEVDKLANLSGSIIDDSTSSLSTIKINSTNAENVLWSGSEIFSNDLKYSEQYTPAFFYREIEVEPVEGSYFAENLIKRVTVTVMWSEGYKPSNLNIPSDRNRQVMLSMLVINDENLYY